MKPIIVTLEPMADGSESTTTVATFEEAFGEHSYAWGKKKKSKDEKTPPTGDGKTPPSSTTPEKKEKTGYFSKNRIDERRTDRKATREKRKADRKAKYGARPLDAIVKNGLKKFKDKLPKLRKVKTADGKDGFAKDLPDGKTVTVPSDQVTTVPSTNGGQPSFFDKKDLNTPNEVIKTVLPNGELELAKIYSPEQTEQIPNEQGGEPVTYKKEDVADSGDASTTSSSSTGMSKGMKIGLIVGGTALVLGIVAFVIYKSKQGKGK